MSIPNHLPTPGWHLWKSFLAVIRENLHTVDIFRTTSSCQRSSWIPSYIKFENICNNSWTLKNHLCKRMNLVTKPLQIWFETRKILPKDNSQFFSFWAAGGLRDDFGGNLCKRMNLVKKLFNWILDQKNSPDRPPPDFFIDELFSL